MQNKEQDLLLIRCVSCFQVLWTKNKPVRTRQLTGQLNIINTSRFNSSLIRKQLNVRRINYEKGKKCLLTKQGGFRNNCIHINHYFFPWDLYCCIKHNLTNYKDFFNRLQDRWPQNGSPGFNEVVGIKQGHEVVTLGATPFCWVWPTHITD